MSSIVKRLEKKVTENKLTFPQDMYTNVFGSIVICAYIFTEDKSTFPLKEVKAQWLKVKKHPEKYIDWAFDDKDFIDKTLKLFNVKKPSVWSICCVMSNFNALFLPFDKEHNIALPLREDGIPPASLKHGKVYPIC